MANIEIVGNYQAQWGEGPIWWNDKLYYVDIEKHVVVIFDPASGEEKFLPVGERVGTVVPRESGGLVIAGDNGLYFLDETTGALEHIVDPEPELENNRFNDGKCSPDGRFFAGTISLVKKQEAALYQLDAEGSLQHAYGPVTNSNGLAWSADASTLYYIDTPRRAVIAFDYSETTGEISRERQVINTGHIDASPDGMTIDAEGKLWVAFCHGSCVVRFCPETGSELQRVELPVMETTACAFGGDNLDELYVTTGIHGSIEEENAGRLYKITGLGVKGIPAFAYKG